MAAFTVEAAGGEERIGAANANVFRGRPRAPEATQRGCPQAHAEDQLEHGELQAIPRGKVGDRSLGGEAVVKLVEPNRAGAGDVREVSVESLQRGGRYRQSILNSNEYADHDTMLALMVDGAELAPDHGYPIRLIAPNRPGVLQTKWVTKLVLK